ncbi:hypothetical protein [Hyphomicrobium sp.]|uniref:hypothetical protein n=1 Tax=Hyphomicrobium sp. TaxID=82 RepID=UPI0025C19937|nr:hypothetical protein [Hyphomicrobium sp.]MCC7253836.1 VRR-NUC domain-containing protein [Hyphomicrobium sp.]
MTPRRPSLSEADLQQHVVKLLNAYGRPDVCWWSCPNGELRNWKVGVRLKEQGLRAGASDLMFVIDGRFHAVELKIEIGTLSGKQLAFAEDLQRAGGFAHVAFGLDDAIGVLKAIGAFRAGINFSTALGKGARSGEGEASSCSPRNSVASAEATNA